MHVRSEMRSQSFTCSSLMTAIVKCLSREISDELAIETVHPKHTRKVLELIGLLFIYTCHAKNTKHPFS